MTTKKMLVIGAGLIVTGAVVKSWADTVASKVQLSFSGFKFEDFWANIRRFQIVCVSTFRLNNLNTFPITVANFTGALSYKEAPVTKIKLDKAITLQTNAPQTIAFRFTSNIPQAIARVFLAVVDKKSVDGGRMKGTLRIRVKGLTVPVPYNEPIQFNL